MKRIAVIGGGPKAAALCAKASAINAVRRQVVVRVFERDQVGAAWSGRHGYSDGVQRLCTPAERDVGFPYERGLLNDAGVADLFARFSWQAFLINRTRSTQGYRDWVDRGRKPPSHSLYSIYLRWVVRQSRALKHAGEVTRLDREGDKWAVTYQPKRESGAKTIKGFDGVVVTGPGPAIRGFDRSDDPRITDGVAFWQNPEEFIAQGSESEEPIIIAGSGGTAAAIAAWITRQAYDNRPIIIVGHQAALFTRTESFFENSLFSDEDAWAALEPEHRIGVSQRLNRGVVWSSVSDALSQARNVRFRPGRVSRTYLEGAVEGAPAELRVEVQDATGTRSDAASLVIDAAGFDSWWFADLLPARHRRTTQGAGAKTQKGRRDDLAASMDYDLSLDIGVEGFHAPMLSLAQGPGFASLMVLGAMSERILSSYVDPA
ncbi:SidA/IucD/PvdA family monooxygenase [Novosphingobium sp. BL-52-GroH]|uniref:SidA/IucD/PvdA family monooxygenase n=1 Tax=Novosphingobium sp. BL-52-GroH TaxID=3349877 RepID=UPI00384E9B0D